MLYLSPEDPLDLVLRVTSPNLKSIYLSNDTFNIDSNIATEMAQNELKVILINQDRSHVKKLLTYLKSSGRKHSIFFIGKDNSEKMLNILTFFSANVTKLHFSQENIPCQILMEGEIPHCVSLTHFTLKFALSTNT